MAVNVFGLILHMTDRNGVDFDIALCDWLQITPKRTKLAKFQIIVKQPISITADAPTS